MKANDQVPRRKASQPMPFIAYGNRRGRISLPRRLKDGHDPRNPENVGLKQNDDQCRAFLVPNLDRLLGRGQPLPSAAANS